MWAIRLFRSDCSVSLKSGEGDGGRLRDNKSYKTGYISDFKHFLILGTIFII